MAHNHRAVQNDHISKLTAEAGFQDWHTIWNANPSLQSSRHNPNLLYKGADLTGGDTLHIPDVETTPATAGTETNTPFVIPTQRLFLRLRILKDDFTALANSSYTLTVEGALAPLTGNTNAQGQIECEIPRASTQAVLTVQAPAPAPGGAAVCAEAPMTWTLRIGCLNPILENAPNQWCISGVQQRLNNLGISTGPIDGIKGRLTEAAIKTFQRLFGLQEDGKPGQGETQPKLRDAHDKPDSILGPKSPPNDSQHAETPADAYGHVCPDFEDRLVFNTLRIRSSYRLTLRLGSIEDLFPHAPNTPEGRMERMQVVGLFYYPLGSNASSVRRALRAFNGIAAAGTTPAVRGLWEYFKTRILNAADDAAADQELQRLLREWVVAGGVLPPAPAEGVAPAEANFVKLRRPGGYTFLSAWASPGLDINGDASAPYRNWGWNNKNLYDAETRYHQDNPVLGKLPLNAKVERFNQATCEWQPAPDAQVYFQLVDPDPLPAFDATKSVTDQLNAPPLRASTVGPPASAAGAGPDRFTQPELNPTGARAPAATDPQRGNCPSDRGGLQGHGSPDNGSDVAGHLFAIASSPGFNAAHTAPAAGTVNPITRSVFFPAAERVNDAERKHCVKAKTNSEGEAGVIFMPSRCGGDHYRLRAFLGPPTISGPGSDGVGASALRVDTGTFVLWRHLRISRYLQHPVGAPDPVLLADAQANLATATIPIANATDYLRRVNVINPGGVNVGMATASFSTTFNAAAIFVSLPVQWARAFVETEVDRAAAGALPEILTQADWQAARQQALADGIAGMVPVSLNLDLAKLLYMEPGAPASIDVNSAIVHMPMRSRTAYNASLTPAQAALRIGAPGNTVAKIQTLIWNYLLGGFLRSVASNGYTPGLVLMHGGFGVTWAMFNSPNGNFPGNSGLAFEHRGGYVWLGAAAYPTVPTVPPAAGQLTYDFTSNCCHELGHSMYRDHGSPPDGATSGAAGKHDPLASNFSICVMSYQACEGQFCSKCLFSFRGWNFSQLPY